jgi:beta-carotene 3-hydroxylase
MENILLKLMMILFSFCGMEGVAWLSHKYLMHGPLWKLHKDHHKKELYGFFENNDFFFLIFAIPGIVALLFGIRSGYGPLFWIGIGICLYGLMYFLVHDVFIHQRIKIFRHTDTIYLKAIRKAHKRHHKHLGKEDGECFGMLWVPFKYFREMKSGKKNEITVSTR